VYHEGKKAGKRLKKKGDETCFGGEVHKAYKRNHRERNIMKPIKGE